VLTTTVVAMAVKFVALYGQPDDLLAWDEHYRKVHLPLAATIPGLQAQRAAEVLSTSDGSASPYHVVGELVFADMASLQAGVASPEGQAASEDFARMAPPGSLLLVAEEII
jgi:uncharacterized protein (TIGR02118 family)